MDNKTKQILLKLVNEIEDVRANLLATSAHPALKISLAAAQDAKNLAKQTHRQHYDELRKEIEAQ